MGTRIRASVSSYFYEHHRKPVSGPQHGEGDQTIAIPNENVARGDALDINDGENELDGPLFYAEPEPMNAWRSADEAERRTTRDANNA